MAQRKGQTGNPKGRPKGKPNKVTASMKEWVQQLIDGNRTQLEADLKALDPKDRWAIVERLMAYVTPRMAAVSVSEHVEAEYLELERLLEKAPDAVVDALYERLAELKAKQDGQG